MRILEFRGKRKDNGKWVCGGIYKNKYIVTGDRSSSDRDGEMTSIVEIIPNTIEQYTGCKIANGDKIFEAI